MSKWYLLKFTRSSVKQMKEILENSSLEYFLPCYTVIQKNSKGQKIRMQRSLMFNMLFLYCDLKDAVAFTYNHKEVNFVTRNNNQDRPSISLNKYRDNTSRSDKDSEIPRYDDATYRYVITIPDRDMDIFIKAVKQNKENMPTYIKPSEIDLEKGDKVRIIGGDFDGVEGILESQQGKDGGTVYVHIQNFIATRTTEIRPEFIQILEFSKAGRHMYKKFDSFMTRGERCVMSMLEGKGISDRDRDFLRIFINRFSELSTPTAIMTAKLRLYMFIAHSCLGNVEKAAYFENLLFSFLEKLNSETLRCLCLTYLYACTNNEEYKNKFYLYIKQCEKLQKDISKLETIKKNFLEIQWAIETA